MTSVAEDRVLDCRGLLCPMPVVMIGREMQGLRAGQIMKVMATDRGAIADLPAWASDTGNEVVSWYEEETYLVFFVRKGM